MSNNNPASLDADFTNEDDIEAFSDALNFEDFGAGFTTDDASSVYHLSRVPTITSQSDWKPIYNRTPGSPFRPPSRAPTKSPQPLTPPSRPKRHPRIPLPEESSLTYTILHYPILTFTMIWLAILSFGYLLVRLAISISEKFILSFDYKRKKLLEDLENAQNYKEYVKSAKELDSHLGLDEWCHHDRYRYYDWKTLRRTVADMRRLRRNHRYDKLMVVLQSCIKSNFAGIENPIMYSHCYYGTKDLIDRYIAEVVTSIDAIVAATDISPADKHTFFKIISRNYGKTALALSGGASFCYNHFGVLKALLENDLMPQIISGTSGGGAIAALACTRTNEELLQLLTPKLAQNIRLLSGEPATVWLKRWWKTGARFDAIQWARTAQWWTMGSTTFKESLERTGKMLNITTVPHDIHSPTIVCNEITSPNCCIWSSILASAAVPGILQPVVLMQKPREEDTVIEPFSFGNKWRDGSMRTDIPLEALNIYYNVRFSLVSQVNPHVMLWIFKNRGDIGKPIVRKKGKTFRGGFIPSYLENLIKLEIIKWLKLIREFQLLPNLAESDWSNIFLQKFGGNITLFPKIRITDFLYILSDPNEERLGRIIRNGEHVTYPTLLFMKHRLSIERAIARGRSLTREYHGMDEADESEDDSIYSDDAESFIYGQSTSAGHDIDDDDEAGGRGFLGIRSEPAVIGSDAEESDEETEEDDVRKTKKDS
ncbi:DEKNAAC101808 [Brettanomyces naardenensis]|uniref:Patatin-like phospholipase domain-containing protein n=1 Tax=Brettanomyces naardenensis TaxID=13370 RepID=A0A448YJD8_BRENA|nr:DEKNAAC101808 [Brettanomyces naardenensis]